MNENLKVYISGDIVPINEAKISVFYRGFQYGDGVFEGLRCYDGKIFELEERVIRLFNSAWAVHIKIPISLLEMKVKLLLQRFPKIRKHPNPSVNR